MEPSKKCCSCKVIKSLTDYYKNKSRKDNSDTICKDCRNEVTKITTLNKPDEMKARALKSRLKNDFGLTPEAFNKMLQAQNNKCASCGKTTEENGKRLCVDHDHKSGKVRGLLCDNCNVALGHLKDNLYNAKCLVNYIEDYC